MKSRVLVDTGPIVAAIHAGDRHHTWVREQLDDIEPPLLTCEAVLTEASHLLRKTRGGATGPLELLRVDVLELSFLLDDEAEKVAALMRRYANVPMSLADACLVRMAEILPGSRLLTLDGDFKIYRLNGRRVVPTLMPPGE